MRKGFEIFTENSNIEEMSKESMPESEDTSTAANHSFPANTSCSSETRRKRKSQALYQLLALDKRKIEQLEKAVQQESIMSTQEDEDYHFLMSLLSHLRDIPKREKLAV
jgi:5-methylcytosine-specific restriction endonuclease McrBC regulatory subunit McrC